MASVSTDRLRKLRAGLPEDPNARRRLGALQHDIIATENRMIAARKEKAGGAEMDPLAKHRMLFETNPTLHHKRASKGGQTSVANKEGVHNPLNFDKVQAGRSKAGKKNWANKADPLNLAVVRRGQSLGGLNQAASSKAKGEGLFYDSDKAKVLEDARARGGKNMVKAYKTGTTKTARVITISDQKLESPLKGLGSAYEKYLPSGPFGYEHAVSLSDSKPALELAWNQVLKVAREGGRKPGTAQYKWIKKAASAFARLYVGLQLSKGAMVMIAAIKSYVPERSSDDDEEEEVEETEEVEDTEEVEETED